MKVHEISELILLEGQAGTGKTSYCLQELQQEISASKDPFRSDILLILPTLEHRERVVDVLLRHSKNGFFNRLVSTFDDVLQSFLKLGGVQFASDVSRYLILKDLIQESKFEYFREAARTKGFVSLISSLITEFKEAFVEPKELEKRFSSLIKSFPSSQTKYTELLNLFAAYEARLLNSGLKDRQDALFLFEEGIKRGEWQFPHFHKIWIDGFYDFSNLQLAFIRFLARHTDHMVITLTTDPKRNSLFRIPEETKKTILEMGFKLKILPSENRRALGELVHIEKYLFTEKKTESLDSKGAVQILEATGLVGEVTMIAREIKQMMRKTSSLHFSDIALIFRQIGAYTNVIRNTFEKFGIPVEIHEREELRLNPLARTVISLFRICLDDWKREDLFNFLKSSFIRQNYEKVCEIEITACRQGVFRGMKNWMPLLTIPEAELLQNFQITFESVKNVFDFVKLTKTALQKFGIRDLPDDLSEQSRRYHSALKRLYLLLDEMELKYANASFEPAHFAQVLIQLIEVDLFSFHHRDKNKVQVYNVSLARQKEYKVVFLPGLLEKEFPIQIKEDPVLSDAERRIFNGTEKVLKERLPRQAVEHFLFYMAVTRAKERLILSYPRFDLEGKEALPSFYVDEVNSIFKDRIHKTKQSVSEVFPELGVAATQNEVFARVIDYLWQPRAENLKAEEESLYWGLYNQFLGKNYFSQILDRLLTPTQGMITDSRIIPHIKPESGIYTPTRLEEYGECAYRYFSNQVLHLQSFEDKIDLRVVGSILHGVLEKFHIWHKKEGHPEIKIEKAKEICDRLLEEELDANPLLGDRWYKIELKKREIRETIYQILIQEFFNQKPPIAGLRPEYFEFEFGFGENEDHLVIETENGPAKLRGKIDRIDVDPSGKFGLVIDYKLGKAFQKKSLENGTGLQLPLYVLAMKQNLGLEPLGAHLYKLSTVSSSGFHHRPNLEKVGIKIRKGNQWTEEEWNQNFKKIDFYASYFINGIEKGEISVRPRNCVEFCPYSSVCRIEKWRLPDIYEENEVEDKKKYVERMTHERV